MNFFQKSKDIKTQTEIEYLKKEIYDLKHIIHFLSTHDKNDIQTSYYYDVRYRKEMCIARYIYNGKLKEAKLPYHTGDFEVTKNDKGSFIIKTKSTLNNFLLYYKVNKEDGTYIDVTEFFEKESVIPNDKF